TARSFQKPSGPRSSPPWHRSTSRSCSTKRHRRRSLTQFNRTSLSKERTGPKTPSSAAMSSKDEGGGSFGFLSRQVTRRRRSWKKYGLRLEVSSVTSEV